MSHRKIKVDSDSEGEDDFDKGPGGLAGANGLGGSSGQLINWDVELSNRQGQVQRALSSSDYKTALRSVLENPPLGAKIDSGIKDKYTKLVMDILVGVRFNDIAPVLKGFTSKEDEVLVDHCLKYVYKGLSSPELYNSSALLALHEKLVEMTGVGGIVRVLTDRRTA